MPNPFDRPLSAEWMLPHEASLRERAPEYLETVIASGMFGEREIRQTELLSGGVSSVVYRIDFDEGSAVVKMAPKGSDLRADATFFEKCQEAGISVPDVIACLDPSEELPVSVMAMDFIDAPSLRENSSDKELPEEKLREMGRIQATLHDVRGRGFGHLGVDGAGKLASFEEQLRESDTFDRAHILRSKGLLDATPAQLDEAAALLAKSVDPENTSLTHNDFLPYNIFDTEPLTVFDPLPRYSHPLYCLGMTIVKSLASGDLRQAQLVLAGYEEVHPVDREELKAAILLRYVHAAYGRDRKGEPIRSLQDILADCP